MINDTALTPAFSQRIQEKHSRFHGTSIDHFNGYRFHNLNGSIPELCCFSSVSIELFRRHFCRQI